MKANGGPAFPIHPGAGTNTKQGMTLRDYFAGQVLNAIASDADTVAILTATCYRIADAMIEERDK